MNDDHLYAFADTPVPGPGWQELPGYERLKFVRNVIASNAQFSKENIMIVSAKEDGQIIVSLHDPLSAARRGALLLDLEDFLKETIDPGLVVWHESLGDRSSLRNLRGIEVKA